MISVDEALGIILDSVRPLKGERAALGDALGRVLDEDVRASFAIPLLDNSAMDGFAVRAEDVARAREGAPVMLEVVDDIRAGAVSKKTLRQGEACRIMTGASLPRGADGVVMVEDTETTDGRKEEGRGKGEEGRKKEYVKILKGAEKGENVRCAGEDIKKGEVVFQKGALISAARLGVLASMGKKSVRVVRRPRVAILATGDEVIDVGRKLRPGKLYSSNSYTLGAAALASGCSVKNLGIARDDFHQLKKKIAQGLKADALISSGGVSVGKYDFVKDVLKDFGADIKFWKVAMRPGKPLVFALIKSKKGNRKIPFFGLPGNPVSSMVSFELFVRPALLKMRGENFAPHEVEAVLDEDVTKKKGLRFFFRAVTEWRDGAYHTRTTGPQGSGILKSMALANSLMVLPEEDEAARKGEKVRVRFL